MQHDRLWTAAYLLQKCDILQADFFLVNLKSHLISDCGVGFCTERGTPQGVTETKSKAFSATYIIIVRQRASARIGVRRSVQGPCPFFDGVDKKAVGVRGFCVFISMDVFGEPWDGHGRATERGIQRKLPTTCNIGISFAEWIWALTYSCFETAHGVEIMQAIALREEVGGVQRQWRVRGRRIARPQADKHTTSGVVEVSSSLYNDIFDPFEDKQDFSVREIPTDRATLLSCTPATVLFSIVRSIDFAKCGYSSTCASSSDATVEQRIYYDLSIDDEHDVSRD